MPTAYTADIKDGIDFKTYAMNCARAFGACVMLRDEPGGGDRIPEAFEPSDYHLKAMEKARSELEALEAMTPAECERAAAKAWDDDETIRLMCLENKRKQREAYEAMLAKAAAWKAPTPDHEGLRKFMCEQIEQSIDFDCGGDYDNTPIVRLTGEAWVASELARCLRNVQYHEKEYADEVSRAATRTEWVRALRAAL
jgi:hypothetical protein